MTTLRKELVPNGNNGRRLIFIGDVHGCLEELKKLLEKCRFDPRHDHIIFVGDLVAKGPFSLDTISYVDDLGVYASCVRGNHDDKLMQWKEYLLHKDDYEDESLPDGLSRRDEHRFLAKNLDASQADFLDALPYIIRIPTEHTEYVVAHAGILPRKKLHKQRCWDVTNMRNIYKKQAVDNREDGIGWFENWEAYQRKQAKSDRQVVIYGHDAGRDFNIRQFSKGLDTRCVRGGRLTAMIMAGSHQETSFVHQTALRRYD